MQYDDDTGRHVHFHLDDEDRPVGRGRPKQLPSPETQDYIIRLAQQPGWDAERVHAYLRIEHNRHDISLATIERIVASARRRR